jgi:hypothetical protein
VHIGVAELADARRLVEAGRQLGEQFGGPDADGAGDAVLAIHLLLDAVGDGLRRPEQPAATGDVEIGLVDGGDLDEVGVGAEQPDHGVVHGRVSLHVDRQEHPRRAQAFGVDDGHGAVDAEDARFVGAGGDHAASAALAADDHRQAAQFGTSRLLDRGEEGVHVEVQDGSR